MEGFEGKHASGDEVECGCVRKRKKMACRKDLDGPTKIAEELRMSCVSDGETEHVSEQSAAE